MIDLPDYPSPATAEPALIDFGAFLTPSLGGPVQRVSRQGTRFSINVTMPPMRGDKLGRQWIAALIRGKQQGARMPFPLQGFEPGAAGSPVVDGAGAAGSTLPIRSATPNYVFRDGQFFSLEIDGQHFLYMVDGEQTADAAGDVSLAITPMLRRQPADGDALHFGKPMIEGFIMGDEQRWTMAPAQLVGMEFNLIERE